ncbi:MAG: DNA-directed RNA polymerase subunit alpha [Candidatus Marinimicrobia bacterium]|nr:DNA-directed RNA polymerase subunit alpha [Candidatus Neomarinimicrobiota bacterium]
MNNKYFQDIKVTINEESKSKATFSAEPFERGYAVTIGNGLRRTLLTALPGAAITSLKIDGVSHEFTTIDGVSEDICDLILNLKKVRFKLSDESANSELISFDIEGPTTLTASKLNDYLNEFKVLNGEEHLAEINSKEKISFEIRVSRGKGYSTADKNKRSDDTLNTIPIDSIYNPIVNVAWDVQTLPASIDGHEKLTLEVESDGSTSAKDALNHAAKIMAQHITFFLFDDSSNIRAVNDEELNEALEIKSILSKSIDEMELSVRSHNCLQAAGIYTIAELVSKEESEMLKFKNFGRKSLTELTEKLTALDLRFGMDISIYMED